MSGIDNVQLEMKDRISNANTVKGLVLDQLLEDNVITQEQFNEYYDKHEIIMFKESWYKNWARKFVKNPSSNSYWFKLVRFEK